MFLISKSKTFYQFCYAASYPSVDYYKVLNISPTATTQQIKSRYYELAKKFHPDMNTEKTQSSAQLAQKMDWLGKDGKNLQKDNKSSANLQFLRINQAYEVLKDTNRRNQYDRNIGYKGYDIPYSQAARSRDGYSYERSERFKNYQQYEQHRRKQQQQYAERVRRQRVNSFNGLFLSFFGFSAGVYLILKFLMKPAKQYMDQNQIRRNNLILSRQNIDSSPFVQEKRMQQYAKEIADKKIRGQVVTLKVRGGAQESTRAKYKRTHGMEGIPGIQKQGSSDQVNLLVQKQEYI